MRLVLPSHVGSQRVVVPDHVVYRDFAAETVVLNLESGQYHGLNPTAGRMLEVLGGNSTVDESVDHLAQEFAQPVERVRADVFGLLEQLADRDIVRFESPGSGS